MNESLNQSAAEPPKVFTAGYAVVLAAAALLLTISMMMLMVSLPEPDFGDELLEAFRRNRRFVAVANMVFAVALACAAAYTKAGSRKARRVLAAVVALAVFVNLAGLFVGAAGLFSLLVVILLAVGMWLLFRPASNAFVAQRSGDVWRV